MRGATDTVHVRLQQEIRGLRNLMAHLNKGAAGSRIVAVAGGSAVKHHLNSIFDKCGASNRPELALSALRHGLARL